VTLQDAGPLNRPMFGTLDILVEGFLPNLTGPNAPGLQQTCRKPQSTSLFGAKRTSPFAVRMSAHDPKRTRGGALGEEGPTCAMVIHRKFGNCVIECGALSSAVCAREILESDPSGHKRFRSERIISILSPGSPNNHGTRMHRFFESRLQFGS
jgi:hypothetical protein